ncbi:MAG: hypothetical protein K8R68_04625, partial [Bacteroidales bacterium]|nr:hypothetical protein [Bacteroidales bacterium]
MKKLTLISAILLLVTVNVMAQQNPVNGEIIGDTNNLIILKVWGTSEERGYAYGYLINEKIKEVSEGFIQLVFGSSYPATRQLLLDGEELIIDSAFLNEVQAVVNGMADAGVDTTDFDYIDLLATNFFFDLVGFFNKEGFGCSTFLNWGDATAGTDLSGGSVISRHYDNPVLFQSLIDNLVVTVFIPSEEYTQPWLIAEFAGGIVPSGIGVNQGGISIYQNTMSDCNCSPVPGVGYEPFELISRKVLESADYNGDGVNNTQDVKDAINSNLQGYAGGYIISTISRWDPESDSLTALIAEIAPEEPLLTIRTNSYYDVIPGDNLYAANAQIKRTNAHNYCTRYLNMVNHIGDGTGIGSAENWNLMADYSHLTYNYMFVQHIPGWNKLNLSNYRDNTNAYLLDPLELDLRELFNRPPEFASEPDTMATINIEYVYEISVSDPDPMDTINITAEQLPDWLTLVDNGDGTALLSGVPDTMGIYPVALNTSDGLLDDTQEFEIYAGITSISELNDFDIKIYPIPVTDRLFIDTNEEAKVTIFSSS